MLVLIVKAHICGAVHSLQTKLVYSNVQLKSADVNLKAEINHISIKTITLLEVITCSIDRYSL